LRFKISIHQEIKVMSEIKFTKMEGLGNDYVYIDCMTSTPPNLPQLSIKMSDRHFGVGGDGVILIMPSEVADFRMRMFNADGSEGKMCGNGSRCVAKFVYDKGLTDKTEVTLETLSGIKVLKMHLGEDGKVATVTVDMGEPELIPANIPVLFSGDKMVEAPVATANHGEYKVTAVSMGNPHGVIFVDKMEDVDVWGAGRELETAAIWPDRANIEFIEVLNDHELRMRVWERGSGETLACGTGACASAVAAALTGRARRKVRIHLLGGPLDIEWREADNHVYMTGPAAIAFEGVWDREY
jgi:diaminopimelate epimerase